MAAPPPYDDSQKYNQGQGPPGYYPQQPGPPGNYPQQPGQPRVVNRGLMGMFGKDPVSTTCPNCGANVSKSHAQQHQNRLPYFIQITTSVEVETGTIAWIAAGIICVFGCWCCCCIPLCMDSLKVN